MQGTSRFEAMPLHSVEIVAGSAVHPEAGAVDLVRTGGGRRDARMVEGVRDLEEDLAQALRGLVARHPSAIGTDWDGIGTDWDGIGTQ